MISNTEIFETALRQSALDINASPEDFLREENVIVRSELGPKARKYYSEPLTCRLVSYGNNIVASVNDEYKDIVSEYLRRYTYYHCFETPNMHWLDDAMRGFGQRVCFMAEYCLPDVSRLRRLECGFSLRLLGPADFRDLYLPEWGNALCDDRKELDVLGVGAYDGYRLIGLAGCSADCDEMWQIGIDVLPEYRKQGVGSALTSSLALEILDRGKIPFYCCAWSNIRSVRNAIRSGFIPSWAELSVKPDSVIAEFNSTIR